MAEPNDANAQPKQKKRSAGRPRQGKPQESAPASQGRKYAAAIGIVIIIIAIAGAIVYGYVPKNNSQAGISLFLNNFKSSGLVGIYVTADNSTELSPAIGCSTALIESILESKTLHRNSDTIYFFVLNSTSCTYLDGLGSAAKAYNTTASVAQCMNFSYTHPSIFINYSSTKQDNNKAGLAICGGKFRLSGRMRHIL
jgi:hypothetical protein